MLTNTVNGDIQVRYNSGERDFSKLQLRRIDLRGANLRGVNLEGSDLSYADLRDADLSNANLSGCYFNEANLTGAKLNSANLQGAYLIKAYLTKANFTKANLHETYLTGSFLTKANLMKADLSGAFLNGAHLGGSFFKGAVYDNATRFDRGFDPEAVGMEKTTSSNIISKRKITVQDLVNNFEAIAALSSHYLGGSITAKYFDSTRPDIEWLKNFTIDKNGKITFTEPLTNKVNTIQLKWFEKWVNAFIKSCSFIIQDFQVIIEEKHLDLNSLTKNSAA